MLNRAVIICCFILLLTACSKPTTLDKVRIGINPWPGYEFLYLASQLNFFAEEGLNIEIVELSSLADVQRVYIQGRVDGFGGTVIEAVQAAGITQKPVSIVLVPDFSAGGDVIIGNANIRSIQDLKGRRVGAEVGSLGMYILHVALVKYGLTLDDVTVVNVEQLDSERAMANNEIDAMVTYPPYSIAIAKNPNNQQIFDTSEIPGQVIDVITIRAGILENEQQWLDKFHRVWQKTLDFTVTNQPKAYDIMAKREQVTVEEFAEALTGLTIVGRDKQHELLGSEQLSNNIVDVCKVLQVTESISFSCNNILQLVQSMPVKQ